MPHQKASAAGGLPSKVCPTCKRPFNWRKKWAKVWANVIYCSDKCRRANAKPSR